jgi:hypothetical protein
VTVLSDAQIAALSPAERQQLIQRLERPLSDLVPLVVRAGCGGAGWGS